VRAREAVSWMRGGDQPRSLEKHENRWDLRGIVFPAPFALNRGAIAIAAPGDLFRSSRAAWRSLDLTGAILPSLRLTDVSIEDCIFDGAAAEDLRMWGTGVADCSFVATDLRGSALATGDGAFECSWRGVNFERTDLRGAHFTGGSIIDSTFQDAKLDGVHFNHTQLESVSFRGVLRDVRIEQSLHADDPAPHELIDVSFDQATFEHADFRGCRFVRCSWPAGIVLIPRIRDVAALAASFLDGDTSEDARIARAVLHAEVKRAGGDSAAVGVLNRMDDVAFRGPDYDALYYGVLVRAVSEIGSGEEGVGP
jgi:uncharacterized protein YjbI with pentapeptide repeats